MREALNLVDFFVSNYVTQDVDISTLEVNGIHSDATCYATPDCLRNPCLYLRE
jgi:hypothetical protein